MRDPDSEDPSEIIGAGSAAFEAGPDAAGARLDQWLTQKLGADFSRSRVQALIRQGAVEVSGKPVTDPGRKLKAGETCRGRPARAGARRAAGRRHPARHPLRGCRAHRHQQAGRAGRPSGRRQLDRHAGQRADPSLRRQPVGHRRRQAAGHRPPPRQGYQSASWSSPRPTAPTARFRKPLPITAWTGDLERAYVALVWGAPERNVGRHRRAARPRRRPRAPRRRAEGPRRRPPCRHALHGAGALRRETG